MREDRPTISAKRNNETKKENQIGKLNMNAILEFAAFRRERKIVEENFVTASDLMPEPCVALVTGGAFFCPRRLAMFIAHAFSHDHFCTRVSMTCAGIVICGRPRLARIFMSVCARRSVQSYVRPLCAAAMATGPDDIRGLNPIHVDELGALTKPRVFPIPGFDRFASRHNHPSQAEILTILCGF